MIRRILLVVLPLVVLAAGLLIAKALVDSYQEPERRPLEVVAPLVRVVEAESRPVRLRIETQGNVAPRTESELVPEVSGRVLEISPSLAAGGFFKEGEVLLRIDPREYELAVIRARTAIAEAELRIAQEDEEARVARKEWDSLGEGDPPPLVVREPQLAQARASLASAEAALEQAKFDLERTVVKAPFDGRVRQKRVDVGQYVQRGAAVATIYSVDVAEVRLPVPASDLAFVDLPLAYVDAALEARGPEVLIEADFAGRTHQWRGRIVRTEGEIDPRTRMVHAIAQVKEPYAQNRAGRPPLSVGMFVRAEILGHSVRAIPVPRTALRGENTVWVVNGENRIEFRELDILRVERERVLVRGGVSDGDRICVSTLEAAVNGMEVRVTEDAAAPE